MNFKSLDKKEYREYKKEKLKLLKEAVRTGDKIIKQIRYPTVNNIKLKKEIQREQIYFMWVLNQPEYYKLLETQKELK
jgi:hypothetical protein